MAKREEIIDILRTLSIWAVIAIHTTTTTIAMGGYHVEKTPFAFLLNQAFRFAVPLFFLISGYVLAGRYAENFSLKTFYKKRLLRLALPFVVWSALYYIVLYHTGVKAFFINLPTLLFSGSAAEHLYFIPAIGVLYILFPLIHTTLRKFPPIKYASVYAIFFLGTTALLFLDYYNPEHLSLPTALRISLLNLPVFSVGMIFAMYKDHITFFVKRNRNFFLAIFLISFLFVLGEGHIRYALYKNPEYFTSQWRPSILLYTIFIFLFGTLYLPRFKIISKLSHLTFFVFFSHIIFVHMFWKEFGAYMFSKSMGHVVEQLWFDPLVFLFVLISSYTLAFLVSYIPKVRDVVGINS